MSSFASSSKRPHDALALPSRWLNCPRKANTLIDKFLPFKVPLSGKFDARVPIECRFSMSMLIESVRRSYGSVRLGLIIDLTNTNRFYDAEAEVKQPHGIKHVKMSCRGHGETPTLEQTRLFNECVETFVRQHPLDIIGVHCTHGFNRTGFLICSYLVEKLDYSIDMAVRLFADARPPGIYKPDYLDELYKRYAADDPSMPRLIAPPYPDWDNDMINDEVPISAITLQSEGLDDLDDDEDDAAAAAAADGDGGAGAGGGRRPKKRARRNEPSKINAKFADPDMAGVETCTDPSEIDRIRREVQNFCAWNGAGFPGAQPVSMNKENLEFLRQKRFMVSWKADGTRYLMYIRALGEIYMLDRDNSVFKVANLYFYHRKDMSRHLTNTLVDGEFVVDKDPMTNQGIPRFLIYDIIRFENEEVGKTPFTTRLLCITKEIIGPRNEAIKVGKINKNLEPFSIRQKQFYQLSDTKKLLSEEFAKQITHGIDGLIFQPVDDPYKGGRCDAILKWKPPSMNSVDFRLVLTVREEIGMLPEKIGLLYVNGYDQPYSSMKGKGMSAYDNKIIECRWHENKWDFMRERVDKSYPNHYTTAIAVCESIKNPITEQLLVQFIHQVLAHRPPAANVNGSSERAQFAVPT